MLLGILLIATSALVGSQLMSSADDTTSVWIAKRTIAAGSRLTAADLTSSRVRFTSDQTAGRYLNTDVEVDGLFATRQIGAGEFVPQDATATSQDIDRVEVPLSVPVGRAPGDIAVGDEVDVWVVPKATGQQPAKAWLVWEGVRLIQVEAARGVAGSAIRRHVVIAVPKERAGKLPDGLTDVVTGEPLLVRRAG